MAAGGGGGAAAGAERKHDLVARLEPRRARSLRACARLWWVDARIGTCAFGQQHLCPVLSQNCLFSLSFTAEKHPETEKGAVEHVFTRVGSVFRHVDEAKQEARVARACAARGNSCTHSPAQ